MHVMSGLFLAMANEFESIIEMARLDLGQRKRRMSHARALFLWGFVTCCLKKLDKNNVVIKLISILSYCMD
jgi:hypothetical protein